ncbi:MAG: endonuclease/exonuclease/phosphatase family protein [Fimbriimonadaceae bacterium]|nr:MAG: endonuclease/exonuclease/phosphatase family protein [Fimbriimonadaceae bacterium]
MRDQESTELPEIVAKELDRRRNRWRFYFVGAVCLLLTFIYNADNPNFAAITIFPSWPWCLLLFIFTFKLPLKEWLRNIGYVLLILTPTLFLTGEEVWTPFNALPNNEAVIPAAVSLNCAGGSIDAAKEAIATGAEIIFLQESPSGKELKKIGEPLGYHVYPGIDGSILIKGKAAEFIETKINYCLIKREDEVFVSLRLQPPIFRLDFYNPECWRSQTENWKSRRQEIMEIVKRVEAVGYSTALLVGDYNATPSQLPDIAVGLKDIWQYHGSGWPGTAVNDFPLARIDRFMVLTQSEYSSESMFGRMAVKKTVNSDHRMVIAYK